MRKKWLILILMVVLVGIFLAWRFWWSKKNGRETAQIKKGEVVEELILTGEIKAEEHAQLTFQTSGELVWVGVKEGDQVKKGQILAKLDTVALNAAYQQALSNLRAAEAAVEKIHDDVKNHDKDETFAQKTTRTDAETAKDKAYEAGIIAQKNLKNAGIAAPFAGIVTKITNPFSGINTSFSQSQIELVNFDSMYLEVSADQTEVTMLSEGQDVETILDAYPDKIIKGKVQRIAVTPNSEETGIVYDVKVLLSGDLENVRIGMTGDVKFIVDRKGNVLYVKPLFISSDKKGSFVTTDKDRKIYIKTGLEGEDKTEISGEEISEGMTVYD